MTTQSPHPPAAPQRPFSFEHLGRRFDDPFAWLEDRSDPAVLPWLEAENAWTDAQLAAQQPLRDALYTEMLAHVAEDDESAPVAHGPWAYFARSSKGDAYRRLYRRALPSAAQPTPADELLLDENELAQGLQYCRILRALPSPDHTRLAWLVDTTGAWVFELWVRDLATGRTLAGPIPNAGYSMAWSSDGSAIFCTRFDHAHRAAEVLRVDLDAHAAPAPVTIYSEADEAFHLDVDGTRSGGYVVITAVSTTTSEVHVLRADAPRDPLTLIAPRTHLHEYDVEHMPAPGGITGGHFLIRTNDAGPNFRLVRAPVEKPGQAHWQEVVPERADTLLERVHPFRSFIALVERSGGLTRVRLLNADGSPRRVLAFPEAVYTVSLGETQLPSGFDQNPDFESSTLRVFYSSLVTPYSTLEVDAGRGAMQVRKELRAGDYDPAQYETRRLMAPSHDGVRVPISLVQRRDTPRDGNRPVLLYGYGAYGYSTEPAFNSRWISLLERGFVVALAHVRGGSELGRAWYEGGRLLQKANTFHDFIACAEALIAEGYTQAGRIAAMGGSAGGLLMGVVTNWRPELWGAVVARVPFTNVISAMRKPELPLTVIEWEQWGDPAIPEQFNAMLAYSPYENIRPQRYPPLLVKSGLNDLQVPYWDPAKYVARLRNTPTGDAPILLRMHMGAGHSGASDRYAKLAEDAEMFAFVIDHLTDEPEPQ